MSNYARTQFYPKHIESCNENGRTVPPTLVDSIKKVSFPCLVLATLLVLLNLAGCSFDRTVETVDNSLQFEITKQHVVVTEEIVRREAPVVHVYPVTEAAGLKVIFVPFRVTQPVNNPDMIGYGISKLFWQTWASMQVFEYMEFIADGGPFRTDSALRAARSKGADLVVSGYVTNLMSGGGIATSTLALQLEAYDVSSGAMVWSMAQAGAIAKPQSHDYVIFATQSKVSSDPIYALTTTLAKDMGKIMLDWSKEGDKKEEAEKTPSNS